MNQFQRAIVCEYVEGIQAVKGKEGRKEVIREIAKRHDLTLHMIQGLLRMGAVEGLERKKGTPMEASPKWEQINYVEVIEDLKSRTQNLERRFQVILDGITKTLDDADILGMHILSLRKMGKWLRGRNSIDVEEGPKLIR